MRFASQPARWAWILIVSALLLAPVARADEDEGAPGASKAPAEEAGAPPMLWVATGPAKVFVLGTIHVPDAEIVALSPPVASALAASDTVFTEIPMSQAAMMGMQAYVMARSQLPAGTTLRDVLGDDLYPRLQARMPPDLPEGAYARMKPWVAFMVVMQAEITKVYPEAAMGGAALDKVVWDRASGARKRVGGLEDFREQIAIFDDLTLEEQAELLEEQIRALDEGEEGGIRDLVAVYKLGDVQKLEELVNAGMTASGEGELGEKLTKTVLTDRNLRMVLRLLARMLEAPGDTYLVAVGAGHIPGEHGILTLLEEAGFEVRRARVGETFDAASGDDAAPEEEPVEEPVEEEALEPAGAR